MTHNGKAKQKAVMFREQYVARLRTGMAPPSLIVIGAFILLTGCSIKQFAVNSVADALASSGSTYAVDDDIQLVGDASPFGLKTMEALLEQVPKHQGLLLSATRGFTQYSYAYVHLPADELDDHDVATAYQERKRARRLYLRARDYGLRSLDVSHPGFAEEIFTDVSRAISATTTDDVAALYWTAVSWAAAISLGKDHPSLIAELPQVEALINRALELDEAFDAGAIHSFLISYEMTRPLSKSKRISSALKHMTRALELSNGQHAGPYVAYAEAVSIATQNRNEFKTLLTEATNIDPAAVPEWTLVNHVMQRRARWLLSRADNYFLD